MRFLTDIFTTSGFGGAIVVASVVALLVTYGLTLRWIADGARHEKATSPELGPHARFTSGSPEGQAERHDYPGMGRSSAGPDRPRAA